MFELLKTNLVASGGNVRQDTMDGRKYTVVPTVILPKQGVLNGSNGPIFYPEDENKKNPGVWDMKPIVVYHPTQNGKPVTACSPEVIEARGIGMMLRTKFKNGVRTESWIDNEKANTIDKRILEAVNAGEKVEVSTGLDFDLDEKEGEFDGKKYDGTARNYRPDHLAVLPDKIGACSIKDGCGLLQLNHEFTGQPTWNELTFGDRRAMISQVLREEWPMCWVVDVFDKQVVFQKDYSGDNYIVGYTIREKDGSVAVTIKGEAKEVVARTQYVSLDGTVSESSSSTSNREKEQPVDKKKIVDGLIANGGWPEKDREFLMGLTDDRLKLMEPKAAPASAAANTEKPACNGGCTTQNSTEKPAEKPAAQTPAPVAPAKPMTEEEYIAAAPLGMREVLQEGVMARNAEKHRLVSAITANEANVFKPEELQAKPITELRGLAALANSNRPKGSYAGAAPADSAAPTQNTNKEEPLLVPTLNFAKK